MSASYVYLGIDGGGSHTRALLCDVSGRILGRGVSGATNPRVTPATELKAHLLEAIRHASVDIESSSIRSVHLGVAGCGDAASQATISKVASECMHAVGAPEASITVGDDLEIVLAGNLSSRASLLIVAGTGSVCYGRDAAGKTVQCGGWGEHVDDAGSGSWIGLRALQVAVRQADGRQSESPLKRRVMEFLRIEQMDAFKARIHQEGLSRSERAELAPIVIELAKSGEDAAARIVAEAIEELCLMAVSASCQLQLTAPKLLFAGGLAKDQYYYELLARALNTHMAGATLARPELSGAAGAVVIALQSLGIAASQITLGNLKKHFDFYAKHDIA